MTFADNAARLAGLAGAMLGWRPADFWDATPQELVAVIRALSGEDAAPTRPPDAAMMAALARRFPDGG